jgi:hypothetical protein
MPPCMRAPQADLAHDHAIEGPPAVQPFMEVLLAVHGVTAERRGAFFRNGTPGAGSLGESMLEKSAPTCGCELEVLAQAVGAVVHPLPSPCPCMQPRFSRSTGRSSTGS